MHAAIAEDDDLARKQSSFRRPDPKVPLSARIRASTVEKLEALVRIWQRRALVDAKRLSDKEARREAEDHADSIDRTYVVDALLAEAADDELALHGGLPETEEQWEAVLSGIDRSAE